MSKNRAVFLDRDGTLNEEVEYLSRPEDLQVFSVTRPALINFRNTGYLNIVITNQSGISRGYFDEDTLRDIHRKMSSILEYDGVSLIDEIYYSPYHKDGIVERYRMESEDRKPGTGMIAKAVSKHNIDLMESFLIGDSLTDMQCAVNAGLRKILVATGYGARDYQKCIDKGILPDYYARDILDASEYIKRLEVEKETKSYN